MQYVLQFILRVLAQGILRRHKPNVIAIAGSVGKTSAKEAIFCVLHTSFKTRKAEGSYNNEIGVPLTIIGAQAQGRNIMAWLWVLMKGLWVMAGPVRYPAVLILEFGEEKFGDIEYLMKLAQPTMSVVTAIEWVHTEFFKDIDGVTRELSSMATLLQSGTCLIVNGDNERTANLVQRTNVSAMTVGMKSNADVRAEQLHITSVDGQLGLSVRVVHRGTIVPVFVPGVIALQQIYALLFACAVGLKLGLNLVTVGQLLRSYCQSRGRAVPIEGLRESVIIDDTYNASPVAAQAILRSLRSIPWPNIKRKVAVLGDMLELGTYAVHGHQEVGRVVHEIGIDVLVTVGALAAEVTNGARVAGMAAANIHSFNSVDPAVAFLKQLIKPHDLILIKGSQGARMERVVKALMAHPEQAHELLVRQDRRWLAKQHP